MEVDADIVASYCISYDVSTLRSCTLARYELMCAYWLQDLNERPSFSEICEQLERLVEMAADNVPPAQRRDVLVVNTEYASQHDCKGTTVIESFGFEISLIRKMIE